MLSFLSVTLKDLLLLYRYFKNLFSEFFLAHYVFIAVVSSYTDFAVAAKPIVNHQSHPTHNLLSREGRWLVHASVVSTARVK